MGIFELFCRAATKPIVGITGSNGKSTVTTLVYEMASAGRCQGIFLHYVHLNKDKLNVEMLKPFGETSENVESI